MSKISRHSKVHPAGYSELDESHEMREVNHYENFRPDTRKSSTWQIQGKKVTSVSRWRAYRNSMRNHSRRDGLQLSTDGGGIHEGREQGKRNAQCVLDSDVGVLGKENFSDTHTYDSFVNTIEENNQALVSSRALIIYFAKLAKASLDEPQEIDFDFVVEMLSRGADINFTDRHGQTIFHEVARIWDVDVAKFVLENGGDVNIADFYGRTPLHIAAAVDYPEMVGFLVEHKAYIHAETKNELQTPVHYAAKNDAPKSLKKLLKLGGRADSRDYKGRTPLQVAAELDRSETAKLLIEQGAHAGVQDNSGSSALSMMISKMTPVAKDAMDQFHSTDRANRRQYYYLNYMEPYKPGKGTAWHAKTPLQCLVHFKQMELIMHPVFRRLIDVKWKQFGRRAAAWQLIVQIIYVLTWTALAITLHIGRESKYYYPPSKYWWRIVMEGIVCSMTLYFILEEFLEFRQSSRSHRKWQRWRIRELQKDLQFCHPRWPAERKYLEMELREISESGISYFTDGWNYFDWVTYGWVVGIVVTRGLVVGLDHKAAKEAHPRVCAVGIIFIWLRLMKAFRAISSIGPFVVMIGHIIKDTLKFGFLYFEFYFPYVCAFWIVFGHTTLASKGISELQNFNDLMYSVWQMTYVGNFPYDAMMKYDVLMAQLLCGTYIAVSGVILLNLFIALMSDTFQRVYDNAIANAEMQRASLILNMEESMSESTRDAYRRQFHTRLAPEELYYDDDSTTPESGDLEKMTHQIKDVVDDVFDIVKESGNKSQSSDTATKEVMRLRNELASAGERHDKNVKEMRQEIAEMKQLMDVLVRSIQQKNTPSSPPSLVSNQKSTKQSRASHRKKHKKDTFRGNEDDVYEEPYEGLPLPPPTEGPLPSLSSLMSRKIPRTESLRI